MYGTRDALIAGGGIIGLSLAIELAGEGLAVTVVERDVCMRGASWAAAGMLAAEDPHNPAALMPLARMSRDLYPEYLARIERLSEMEVPLRTRVALQESDAAVIDAATIERLAPGLRRRNFTLVEEGSLDPRDLCAALPVAARSMGVEIIEHVAVLATQSGVDGVTTRTTEGDLASRFFVDCRGVGSSADTEPRKGQMLTVAFEVKRLGCVVRTEDVYLVPRGDGSVVIGATVERGVTDTVVHSDALDELVALAEALLPGMARAERLGSWAGIRPGTADDLPVVGATGERGCFVAAGHFKNGILLAPATACVVSRLVRGEEPGVSLDLFWPGRFVGMRR